MIYMHCVWIRHLKEKMITETKYERKEARLMYLGHSERKYATNLNMACINFM